MNSTQVVALINLPSFSVLVFWQEIKQANKQTNKMHVLREVTKTQDQTNVKMCLIE